MRMTSHIPAPRSACMGDGHVTKQLPPRGAGARRRQAADGCRPRTQVGRIFLQRRPTTPAVHRAMGTTT